MLQTDRKYFWFSFFNALLFSLLWGSRAGFILTVLALLFWILRGRGVNLKTFLVSVGMFLFLVVVSLVLSTFLPPDNALNRFFNLQKEIEYGEQGIGRLGFYFGAVPMLKDNIFGYGVGNAVRIMGSYTGIQYKENNVHNIYLQYLLDGGIQSLILALFLHFKLLFFLLKDRFSFPPLRVAYSYLLIGFIQFTGYDMLGWFFVGYSYAYIVYLKREAGILMQGTV